MRSGKFWTVFVLILAVSRLQAAEPAPHAPDELIVRFKTRVSAPPAGLSAASFSSLPSASAGALASVGARALIPMRTVRPGGPRGLSAQAANAFEPFSRTYKVTLPPGSNVQAAVERLSSDPSVELAEPNHRLKLFRFPNDVGIGPQWHHRNAGQVGGQDGFDPVNGIPGADVDMETAWDSQIGAAATIVAVIDSGLDTAHPDIAGNLWTNPNEVANGLDDDLNGIVDDLNGANTTNNTGTVTDNCGIEEGHGTHVAGIIGAVGNNGVGVSGVAWDVQVMPLKVAQNDGFCSISTLDIAEAVNYAVSEGADVINMSLGGANSATMQAAVDAAQAAGVVLVAAAGNSSTSLAEYPAAYDSVIGVAATDRRDARATFSNFGSFVSLAAPGVAIRSTWPTADGSYAYVSGTSMSSPLVAGIAALILTQYPALTPEQVEQRLLDSCEDIGVTGIGAGRVNAARALLNVTAISPAQAPADQNVTFTLSGVAFHAGVSFRLTKTGSPTIIATSVNVTDQDEATCVFNVPSTSTGVYNVQVVIGQTIVTLPGALTIFGLNITAASPDIFPSGAGTGPVTITGQNFGAGMAIHLEKSGEADIPGASLVINSGTEATVEFDLTAAAGGRWDVVLTSATFEVRLARGFAVTTSLYQVVTPPVGTDSQFTMALAQGTAVLDWPANATATAINVDINGTPVLPAIDAARDPFVATGVGVDLEQVGASPTFAVPYRLTLPFQTVPDETKLSALSIAFFNTTTGRWQPLKNVTVDTVNRTVSGSSNHFSHYQIVQHVPSADLDRSIAFPNPFRPDRGHDRIVFDFLTAGSTVKIFDLSGRLVRELSDNDNDGRIDWVGVTNEDGETIASGIYYYLATGGGHSKSGRVAVVR